MKWKFWEKEEQSVEDYKPYIRPEDIRPIPPIPVGAFTPEVSMSPYIQGTFMTVFTNLSTYPGNTYSNDWKCEYCKGLNSKKIFKCIHCGAPRKE